MAKRVQQPDVYRAHLRGNVGDGLAYAGLAHALRLQSDAFAPTVLEHSTLLAPSAHSNLMLIAERALSAQDWPRAAQALVHLVERYDDTARVTLLALMQAPGTADAVLSTLNQYSYWLDDLLANASSEASAQSLQSFASAGYELGVVSNATILMLVDRLQQEHNWLDAYALWVMLHGRIERGLINPGFDRPTLQRGFDWRWPHQQTGRRGLRVEQVSAAPRPGLMLQVELTGRAALPVALVSQALILPMDRYRLIGRYASDRMQTRDSLVWTLRCASDGSRWAQTPPLEDTTRKWRDFELEFEIPNQCEHAVLLQLELTDPMEAPAGMTGVLHFDDFALTALP